MLRQLGLVTTAALAVQWAPASAALFPAGARAFRIPTRLESEDSVLLTFDDGPHSQGTPAVLAALDASRTPAVFFVSGEQAALYPGLVREIVAAGHELALHGHRHQTRRQWSASLIAEDTRRALETLAEVTDVVPRLYRPPHGVFTWSGHRRIRRLGLVPLLWSRWGRDWQRGATPTTIAHHLCSGLRPGDVLLLHDADHYSAPESWRGTVTALPVIMDRIAAAGLRAGRSHVG